MNTVHESFGKIEHAIACFCDYDKKSYNYLTMEQCALKNVNNDMNINIYSYLETSGGQSCNLYLNVVHFYNTSVNEISEAT